MFGLFFISGAFIKLRDSSWAPVIEQSLGARLMSFVCSNDEDSRTLNRMIDQVVTGRSRPNVITAAMTGQVRFQLCVLIL